MTTIPLSNFEYYSSTNFNEFDAMCCRSVGPHRSQMVKKGVAIDGKINRADLGKFCIQAIYLGPPSELLSTVVKAKYMLHMPVVGGAVDINIDRVDFEINDYTAAVISPGSTVRAHWHENTWGILVTVGEAHLSTKLAGLMGRELKEPLCFEPVLDLNSEGGAYWKRVWDYIFRELDSGAPHLLAPIMSLDFESYLSTALLTCVKHNYSDLLRSHDLALPEYVRRTELFMLENLQNSLSLSDMVAASGVSERTLYRGFMRHRGCPPMRYLKLQRLDHIHTELKKGSDETAVTEVATRFGFYELGRFSVEYKQRFDESPSQTLKLRNRKNHTRPENDNIS